jgi:queuine tRNA-ribosyltransferase
LFRFDLLATSSGARRGRLVTAHGEVETPAFMPVATAGTVKALTPAQVDEVGAEILLCNTYHLMLRPGPERVAAAGGLHPFMHWAKPLLTDSGGYQVASLAGIRRVTEEGVVFRSHLDGSSHLLTPERAVAIQEQLGSDIAMVLDECVLYLASWESAREAAERSRRWAERCLRARASSEQALFGIVQGGSFAELRRDNARAVTELELSGYGIGGLAVGEPKALMLELTALSAELLPADRPRHLMGVGTPADIIEAVARGVDLFDCVLPTRNARNGTLFTHQGRLSIKNSRFADDQRPVDPDCSCYTCRNFSRAYLRHLFVAREMTAATLNTLHNLSFYLQLMAEIRAAIEADRFPAFRAERLANLAGPVGELG